MARLGMPSFPLSSKTLGILVDAVVTSNTATTMQTLFLRANLDRWVVDAPNKEATVQRLLQNLREDASKDACDGVLELTRLLLVRGKPLHEWSEPITWWEELRNAAAADGWEFDATRDVLVPTVPGAVVTNEVSWIERDLVRRGWTTPAGHYRQAIDSFAAGNWAAANGQLRTFFESLMRTAGGCTGSTSGQVQAAADALNGEGLLLSDEPQFVKTLWKLLHTSGSHPGLSDQDESRFRLLTLTGYARFLLTRLAG